jgi:hypothetical protein
MLFLACITDSSVGSVSVLFIFIYFTGFLWSLFPESGNVSQPDLSGALFLFREKKSGNGGAEIAAQKIFIRFLWISLPSLPDEVFCRPFLPDGF